MRFYHSYPKVGFNIKPRLSSKLLLSRSVFKMATMPGKFYRCQVYERGGITFVVVVKVLKFMGLWIFEGMSAFLNTIWFEFME